MGGEHFTQSVCGPRKPLASQWQDLDLDRGRLHVRRSRHSCGSTGTRRLMGRAARSSCSPRPYGSWALWEVDAERGRERAPALRSPRSGALQRANCVRGPGPCGHNLRKWPENRAAQSAKGGLEPHRQSRFRNEFAGRVTWRPPETAWKRLPSLPPATAIRRVEAPEEPLSPVTWAPAEAWRRHADPDSVDGAARHRRTLKPKALTSVPKNAGQFAAPVGERTSSGHLTSRRSALRSVRSAMKSPR